MMNTMSRILEAVHIKAGLTDLFCEMEVTQIFRNAGNSNIEAVYTFPLPHGAVLLDLVVTVGGRELRGTVLPKAEAGEQYEQSLADGDGAIMLEKVDDGIYTINIGNLLPGESARLAYRYGHLLDWRQGVVKLRIPTTIAPRYGDPVTAGYQPHQVPETEILADNRYSLHITVTGLLASAEVDCPSHEIAVRHDAGQTEIGFQAQEAFMDRDFILNFRKDAEVCAGRVVPDPVSNGHIALASFCPQFPGGEIPAVCIKIVVDCSGSMAGDSITQARSGMLRVLESLREADTFNVIRFGSTARAYFPSCVPARGRNLRNALAKLESLDADMGGTEMGGALDLAYGMEDSGNRPAMVLLITDGAISGHKEVMQHAMQSGHRVFTVGVGSAVAEEFVRSIAENTGGACELVSPNEGMADAIYRQFRRMLQQRVAHARVEWPAKPEWVSPANLGAVYGGETRHLFASFAAPPQGAASLILELPDGNTVIQQIGLTQSGAASDAMPRIAISERIKELEQKYPELTAKLALDYRLVTGQTNYLILDQREEGRKAQDLPRLARVSQMLAAGWGGTGSAARVVACCRMDSVGRHPDSHAAAARISQLDMGSLDLPAFLREEIKTKSSSATKRKPVERPEAAMPDFGALVRQVVSDGGGWLESFRNHLLPMLPVQLQRQIEKLHKLDGWSEAQVSAAVVMAIARVLKVDMRNPEIENATGDYAVSALVRFFAEGLRVHGQDMIWSSEYELAPAM